MGSTLLLTQAKRHQKDTNWPTWEGGPAALQGFELGHFKPCVHTFVHHSPVPYFMSKKTSFWTSIHETGHKAGVRTYGERASPGKRSQSDWQKEPAIWLTALQQVQGEMENPAFSTGLQVIFWSTEKVFTSRIKTFQNKVWFSSHSQEINEG